MVAVTSYIDLTRRSPLEIAPDYVHLWRVELDREEWEVRRMAAVLSEEERKRAQKRAPAQNQARFIVGRAALRLLLARYVDDEPQSLLFNYGFHGKPTLSGVHGLTFNLSHSQGTAVLAIAKHRQVGVDIEYVRSDIRYEQIAQRFLSPGERERLLALSEPISRLRAFFACWTRKEAYIKARGDGLSLPLDSFDVSFNSDKASRTVKEHGLSGFAVSWHIQDFSPAENCSGAVAVEGDGWQLRHWEYVL